MGPKKTKHTQHSVYQLVKQAAATALDKKASDVIILDLKQLTSVTDYFVICSGDVDMHVKAIIEGIEERLAPEIKPWHIEGKEHLTWVLMDYVDFVVHVFQQDTRNYYNIERLWADAPQERIESD